MATSGSFDFSLTCAQIIQSAWEDLGLVPAGGTVGTADLAMARNRLNMLVKQLGTADGGPGIPVVSRQRIALFLAKGQQKYTIGPATTDSRATTSYGRTTLSANASASATTLSITSNTDTTTDPGTTVTMTAGDFIGIVLNDGTTHWTTISGTPGATATITSGLASAASSGKYVYWFTARAQRFPTLEAAVLRTSGLTDTPLGEYEEVAQYEQRVADKYADGDPSMILVEPQRLNTRIILNSQPTDVTKQIILTVLYPAEDYDATTDDIAFPQEGFLYLSWALAKLCAPNKGVMWSPLMEDNYKTARSDYLNLNPENSVLYFQPG